MAEVKAAARSAVSLANRLVRSSCPSLHSAPAATSHQPLASFALQPPSRGRLWPPPVHSYQAHCFPHSVRLQSMPLRPRRRPCSYCLQASCRLPATRRAARAVQAAQSAAGLLLSALLACLLNSHPAAAAAAAAANSDAAAPEIADASASATAAATAAAAAAAAATAAAADKRRASNRPTSPLSRPPRVSDVSPPPPTVSDCLHPRTCLRHRQGESLPSDEWT